MDAPTKVTVFISWSLLDDGRRGRDGFSEFARGTGYPTIHAYIPLIVGSVNFLSYRYRANKSTIFGMRGLWGLTINSGRGATMKYL